MRKDKKGTKMSKDTPQDKVRDALLNHYKIDYDKAEFLVILHADLIKRRWNKQSSRVIADEVAYSEGLREL